MMEGMKGVEGGMHWVLEYSGCKERSQPIVDDMDPRIRRCSESERAIFKLFISFKLFAHLP